MTTVALDQKWVETAQLFGDAKSIIKEAVRAYAIQQCQQRVNDATAKVEVYRRKYACDYQTFKKTIQTDEDFLAEIQAKNPLWEQDAIEWEYWIEEQQTWRNRLANTLQL